MRPTPPTQGPPAPATAAAIAAAPKRRRARDDRPRVALIVETSLAPGREILMGVARYLREHAPWGTFLEPRSLEEVVPSWLSTWNGQGIIARVQNRQIADAVIAAGIPAVDVLGVVQDTGLPLVHTDDARISALAAEHLLERGFRHLAFFNRPGERWSERRRDAFVGYVEGRAHSCVVFDAPRHLHHTKRWEEYADDLARWIADLPKPAGLMLCSDQIGPIALEACRRAGASVPDEVAVIGVDNDEPLCEVAAPGLSSVRPDHERVGYEAAALLDRMIKGQPAPVMPIYVPPRGVVIRRSSDVTALEDREAAAAIRVIRERACDAAGLTIDDVAAEVAVSRSVLQRRFKRAVGRTLHEEMLRVRLARARELLAETDLPIATVAEKSGFHHQEYLGVVFRQRVGTTPAKFRREHRHPRGRGGATEKGGQ
jgi:LacI family transcriptional regulator